MTKQKFYNLSPTVLSMIIDLFVNQERYIVESIWGCSIWRYFE